jgi:hypothetical protein
MLSKWNYKKHDPYNFFKRAYKLIDNPKTYSGFHMQLYIAIYSTNDCLCTLRYQASKKNSVNYTHSHTQMSNIVCTPETVIELNNEIQVMCNYIGDKHYNGAWTIDNWYKYWESRGLNGTTMLNDNSIIKLKRNLLYW